MTRILLQRWNKIFLLFFLVACGLMACNAGGNHTADIQRLDSLEQAVATSAASLLAVDSTHVSQAIDSVTAQVQYVQDNFVGEMRHDLAMQISQYRSIKKKMPDFSRRFRRLLKESDVTRLQLSRLRNALDSGATRDAEGHVMDEAYFRHAIDQETTVAKTLLGEMQEVLDASRFITMRYDSLMPVLKPAIDSIPLKASK